MIEGPDNTKRTVVLGRTGSGKTQFSCHLLSGQNFVAIPERGIEGQPWVIIDYKGDELIQAIVRQNKVKEILSNKPPPTKPGLYYMRPRPHLDDDALENWLMRVWSQERVGIYIDEGYALPQKAAFDMILTQGRSKRIPVIALYQRPVYMSRFAVAQADFFAAFDQNDERDLKTTNQFIKPVISDDGRRFGVYDQLPPYYCLWYNVGKGKTSVLRPAPSREVILRAFKDRLNPTRQNRIV
jgi:hypothetical protein